MALDDRQHLEAVAIMRRLMEAARVVNRVLAGSFPDDEAIAAAEVWLRENHPDTEAYLAALALHGGNAMTNGGNPMTDNTEVETRRWRVVIVAFEGEDDRLWIRRAFRARRWHWTREWSKDGGRWWADREGYTETVTAACRKSMRGWWLSEVRRMEIAYAIELPRLRSEPLREGQVRMELLQPSEDRR